ncbi:hypothetical protein GLOIN_2v1785301 [Rhizophagus clarus]|uniref:Uncharacterized protein n=1 Tax=Rhizophagus clarus TaxID=94130 RepID=A0A8H3LS09_9GLOM|nr:hypothetical protein GLOIN_2v1785301 [Rhizophagus clarus]
MAILVTSVNIDGLTVLSLVVLVYKGHTMFCGSGARFYWSIIELSFQYAGNFLTTIGYAQPSFRVAKSFIYDILLVDISDLITQFTLYVNRKKRLGDDDDVITVENAEFESIEAEEDSTLSLFGIEIKGKVM